MKTFSELTEKKLCKLFMEFNNSPELASYIASGFPVAISSYLKKKLKDSKAESVSITLSGDGNYKDLMTFSLNVVKKGDAVAFIPEFTLGTGGRDLISSDEIEFDEEAMTNIANGLNDEGEILDAFKNAFAGKIFLDDSWEDISSNSTEKGLIFDCDNDVTMAVAAVIASIFEVLCNNKDASSDIEYNVPGLGKFKVSPVKDGYNVSLAFDKQFKSNCKSDKLSEELAG